MEQREVRHGDVYKREQHCLVYMMMPYGGWCYTFLGPTYSFPSFCSQPNTTGEEFLYNLFDVTSLVEKERGLSSS